MFLYSIPELKSITDGIYKQLRLSHNFKKGRIKFAQYINGEWHTEIFDKVLGQDCLIVGSLTPPSNQLLKTLILAHTLKKEGAGKITAILPYLAYCRHDKLKARQSYVTDLIGKMLQSAGIDKIITIDIHSLEAASLMGIPVTNISSSSLFIKQLTRSDLVNMSVLAPDFGARDRANSFRQAVNISKPIAYFKKIRTKQKIKHTKLIGKITNNVIIVDDVLDTGYTLISCIKQLKKKGVKKIIIVVSHGLFMGEIWPQLFKLGVSRIITTDSAPNAKLLKNSQIKIVSCISLLAQIIKSEILQTN